MDLSRLPMPSTATARRALEVSTRFSAPALVNHCLRSYCFAAGYGLDHGIDFDAELLYVAAMLHDLGLSEEFDTHEVPFEVAGGHVAWVFAAGAGWSAERRDRTALAIVDHMRDVSQAADPEGYLLEIATSLDISGVRPEAWSETFRRAVVENYPRLDLVDRFVRSFEDQAVRKPTCAAADSVRRGIATRIRSNPLDRHDSR